MTETETSYERVRNGETAFYAQQRGLIAVWGKEAVQFLDGLISNDMKTLEDGGQMLAAFPNAQGRLLAVVRVLRQGDRYLFDTEDATREKVFQNLFRFTFAGDFFVEDLSDKYTYFEVMNAKPAIAVDGFTFLSAASTGYFVEKDHEDDCRSGLIASGAAAIPDKLYQTLRIENGVPKYGIDMDETTIVPELGLEGLISYNKGCYIGQEIIARIYFRGHVAKRLTGIMLSDAASAGTDLTTADGKNAGRITSVTRSPKLEKYVALAYVRYDYLAAGTELKAEGITAVVTDLPIVN